MSEKRPDDALTRLLRAGDPAAGDPGLDSSERALMRQRILATGREGGRRSTGWLLPAATAMALMALALGLALRQSRTSSPDPFARPARAALAATSIDGSSGRQIQFTTDNGILVVWVLQPRPTS
jgi:hypothetical protein